MTDGDSAIKYAAPAPSETVSATLMRSDETPATIASVRETSPNARIVETPAFVRIEAEGSFDVDVADIADRVGREVHLADWLVNLSSYVGRVHVDDDRVTFTSAMLQFGDVEED